MRIPSATIDDAPAAARPLLAELIQFSPTGRLLNLHAQMAQSPAVLEAYVAIRRATATRGTLDLPLRTALDTAAAGRGGRVPRPDGFHVVLPQLRRDRAGRSAGRSVTWNSPRPGS
jgi:hypothetical protein